MNVGSAAAARALPELRDRPEKPPEAAALPEKEQTRGERIVARRDRDGDGRISAQELEGAILGKRIGPDRYARMDQDDDGLLSASELTEGLRRGRPREGRAEMMESVVTARMADWLAEKAGAEDAGADLAAALLRRLDADRSGALNSEEIAGSRLAEKIGSGFYDLDADRTGTLDAGELAGFLRAEVLGLADPATGPGGAPPDVDPPEGPSDPAAGAPIDPATPGATAGPPAGAPSDASATAQRIRSEFETALALLQSGQDTRSAFEVVSTLYGSVQGILGQG